MLTPAPAAFRRELGGLLPRLRGFAYYLCQDLVLSDDLVQACCQRALEQWALFQPGTQLDRWLFRILKNLWIDRLRATPAEAVLEDEAWEALPAPDWQAAMERRLLLDQVLAALGRLPPPLRLVLVLVCVEDLSYRETADLLEIPIGTVMSRLSRARAQLLQTLGTDHDPSA
ncbi:MAG TPA: RNA polymerase sigma factor [Nevskiaceae bacterium]|nr:RNA polymerase sigma factor [Nevskiaceae bacterium]